MGMWGVERRVRRAMDDGNWPAIVELAKKHGPAATRVEGEHGLTPLHHACHKGKMAVAAALIDCGADVAARSKRGATPLHAAARADRARVCDLLVTRGRNREGGGGGAAGGVVDVDAADDLGATPLHEAVWRGHRAVVNTLLAHGANPHARNAGGDRPVDLVRGAASKEIRAMLLRAMKEEGEAGEEDESLVSRSSRASTSTAPSTASTLVGSDACKDAASDDATSVEANGARAAPLSSSSPGMSSVRFNVP